jgi:C4-dicarboxylate-specific signal transduction histidine kinase
MAVAATVKQFLIHRIVLTPRQWMFLCAGLLVFVAIIGIVATNYVVDEMHDITIRESEAAMHSLSVYLSSEFKEIERTVDVLAGLPWVAEALESGTPELIGQTNRRLYQFNEGMKTSVCYILNRDGMAIAASNYLDERSMVGHSYSFRNYYTQAMRGVPASSYLMGVTTLTKGYYTSLPVRDSYGRIIGVAVVKQELNEMETFLQRYPISFFINRPGIIILASNPEYSLKSLWPVDKKVEQELLASRLYGDKPFEPLFAREVTNGMELEFQGETFLATREYIGQEGISIVYLARTHRANTYRTMGYTVTAAMVFFLLMVLIGVFTMTGMKRRLTRENHLENIP